MISFEQIPNVLPRKQDLLGVTPMGSWSQEWPLGKCDHTFNCTSICGQEPKCTFSYSFELPGSGPKETRTMTSHEQLRLQGEFTYLVTHIPSVNFCLCGRKKMVSCMHFIAVPNCFLTWNRYFSSLIFIWFCEWYQSSYADGVAVEHYRAICCLPRGT